MVVANANVAANVAPVRSKTPSSTQGGNISITANGKRYRRTIIPKWILQSETSCWEQTTTALQLAWTKAPLEVSSLTATGPTEMIKNSDVSAPIAIQVVAIPNVSIP